MCSFHHGCGCDSFCRCHTRRCVNVGPFKAVDIHCMPTMSPRSSHHHCHSHCHCHSHHHCHCRGRHKHDAYSGDVE